MFIKYFVEHKGSEMLTKLYFGSLNEAAKMPDDTELDEITDRLLEHLIMDRKFQNLWASNVAKALQIQSVSAKGLLDLSSQQPSTSNAVREDPVFGIIEELSKAVDFSVETFLRSAELAFCHLESEVNRDADKIYYARVQVEKLCELPRMNITKLAQISRRMLYLLKTFNTRVGSPLQLANFSLYASSICDFLYMIDDFVGTRYTIPESGPGTNLRKGVTRFNNIVVLTLEQMVLRAEEQHKREQKAMELENRRTVFYTPPTRRTQQFAVSSGFVPIEFGKRRRLPWDGQPTSSWIMSKELVEQKARLSKSLPRPVIPRTPVRPLAPRQRSPLKQRIAGSVPPASVRQREAIEKKWKKILDNQTVFVQTLTNNEEGKVSTRLAREITDKVLEELKKSNTRVS